ncbi:MAG: hypothetical protein ABJN84_16500, partial [Flavobacteriaceae bacterium]
KFLHTCAKGFLNDTIVIGILDGLGPGASYILQSPGPSLKKRALNLNVKKSDNRYLNELEFFRTDYSAQEKLFNTFQYHFEIEYGKSNKQIF